jgi:membrane associated rhomboid family serine protease
VEDDMARSLARRGNRALTHVQSTAGAVTTSVATLWVVHVVNLFLGGGLLAFGIHPHTLYGLIGILFAPFLHASFGHLLMNSISFVILGGILMLRDRRDFLAVSLTGAIGSGLGAWLLGASGSVHIGLSGVLFAYLGFLMARGIFERSLVAILLSVTVTWLFGSMVWGVLPLAVGVSWQAHLFGFLAGLITAARLRVKES